MSEAKIKKYIITAQEGIEHERAAVVRYLRAMADTLRRDVADAPDEDGSRDGARLLLRDAALLEATALDIEQRLHHFPERLRELGVTE
jgi:hypothetical protein